jgi:polyribonucleotide nucleotidyltransferase
MQYGDYSGSYGAQTAGYGHIQNTGTDPALLEAVRAVAKSVADEVSSKLAQDPEYYAKATSAQTQHTCTMKCPQAGVGKVIGRRGESIANVQAQTGCSVQVDQSTKELGYSLLILSAATEESLQRGMLIIEAMIASTQPILLPEGIHHLPSGQEQHVVDIPESTVGGVIGVRGATIQHIINEFNVTMYVDQSSPVGMNKKAAVIGPRDNCLRAVARIHDIISGRWQPGQEAPPSQQQVAYDAYYAAQAVQASTATAGQQQAQEMTPELIAQWLEYYKQYCAAMGQPVPPEILASLGQQTNQ